MPMQFFPKSQPELEPPIEDLLPSEGLPSPEIEKKKSLLKKVPKRDLPSPEGVHDALTQLRDLQVSLETARSGLQATQTLISRASSLMDEVSSRLRSTRTMKTSSHLESIEIASDELSSLVEKKIPELISQLSTFVVVKLPPTSEVFSGNIKKLLYPETKTK